MSVLAWGIGVGAKLYDLVVLAGAWSAAPPDSLVLLPYGPRFPVGPGEFFMVVSPTILITSIGALVTARHSPTKYRRWLWSSALLIFLVFLETAAFMWSMNAALYAAAPGSPIGPGEGGDIAALARQWVAYDWLRVAMMAAGFVSAVQAISQPQPST